MVSLAAQHGPRLVPGRIATLPEAVIMRHPVPMAAGHLLALPRTPIADAREDSTAADHFWEAIARWLDTDAADHGLTAGITNVGERQDVPLLHVHLMCRTPTWFSGPGRWAAGRLSTAFAAMRTGAGGPQTASYGFPIERVVTVSPKWRIYQG